MTTTVRLHSRAALVALALGLVTAVAWAQEAPPGLEERLRKLEDENAALRSLLERLTTEVEALRTAQGTEREKTAVAPEEGLLDMEALLADTTPAAPQSESATGDVGGDPALNPLIAFTFDYAAKMLDSQPKLYDTAGGGRSPVLGLRSVEMNAKRGVSAYADAFVTYGDHGHGPELEEGYVDINRLIPGTNIRLGKWRVPFGPYNGVHEHQLPFLDYPRSLSNFFGGEGCQGIGMEVSHILPVRDFLELRLGAYSELGSETDFVFSEDPGSRYSWSGRVRYNRPLSAQDDLDFTLSFLNGPNDDGPGTRTDLWNAAVQWRRDRGNQRSDRLILDWTGMNRDTGLGSLRRNGWAATYLHQAGLYWDWGLMYEDAEFGQPALSGRARAGSAFVTWKAQETQWFRLQYRRGSYPTGPDTDELMFQSIWSIGSHSHEFQ